MTRRLVAPAPFDGVSRSFPMTKTSTMVTSGVRRRHGLPAAAPKFVPWREASHVMSWSWARGYHGAMVAESFTRRGMKSSSSTGKRRDMAARARAPRCCCGKSIVHCPSSHRLTVSNARRAATRQASGPSRGLLALTRHYRIPCHIRDRLSLYLAVDDSGKSLRDESDLRARANLPGVFLGPCVPAPPVRDCARRWILSPLVADADPVELTHELLKVSIGPGPRSGKPTRRLSKARRQGHRRAPWRLRDRGQPRGAVYGLRHARIVRPTIQRPTSSWAIATEPQPQNLCRKTC